MNLFETKNNASVDLKEVREKECPNCNILKPFEDFPKNKNKKNRINSWCKICTKKLNKKYYQNNKEKHKKNVLEARHKRHDAFKKQSRQYMQKRRKERAGNIEWELKKILYDAKKRAKRKEILFDIDFSFLEALFEEQQGKCALSGRSLELNNNSRSPNSLSIDRIDSSNGYIETNVRLVIWAANVAMQEWGFDHLIELAKAVIND